MFSQYNHRSLSKVGLTMLESNEFSSLSNPLANALNSLSPDNRRLIEEMTRKLLELQGIQDPFSNTKSIDLLGQVPQWLNSLLTRGYSPGTLQVYHFLVVELLKAHPNPTPVLIDAHLALKSGSGVSPQAIANRVFALKSFFSYLEEMNILPFNPAQRLKAPRLPHRERKIPQTNPLVKLLDSPTTSIRDRALILLMSGCGLRVSEATKICLTDLVLKPKPRVTVIGKGNKQRTVPVPKHTAKALRRYLSTLPSSTTWLFPGLKPARPISSKYVSRLLNYLCDQAGVPHISPHQLRHYYASSLLNKGANLKAVSNLLGHANPGVTASVYWHLMDAKAMEKAVQQHNPLAEIEKARKGGPD